MGRVRVNRLLRLLCAVVLGALLASCSSVVEPPPPTPASTAPGPGVAALDGWKLTIPQAAANGSAAVVDPARVTPPWLTTDPGGNLVFWAPVAGATTEHSTHARTELDNATDFAAGSGPQSLTASVSVGQVPTTSQEVIIGQIHGAGDISSISFVMLMYTAGTVKVVVKQQRSGDAKLDYPLLTGVPIGARFDYGIRDNGNGSFTFTAGYADQKPSADAPVPAAFQNATVRFQAGAYQQDVTAAGSTGPDDGARVTFYALGTGTAAAPS